MALKAPSDRRFRRARVQAPRKRRAWKHVALPLLRGALVTAVSAYAITRGVALATSAPALRVGSITVHGARQLGAPAVLDRVRGLRGQNIVVADLGRWRAELLKWAWVRDASFRRVLPSTVEIAIVEREPMGIGRIGDRLFLVAADGTTLGPHASRGGDYDLPLIDGLHVGPSRTGLLIDEDRAELAARLIDSVGRTRDLAGRLSQVDVSDVEDAVVMLDDDAARVHLGHEQFAERLRAYLDLAPTLKAQVASIDYVDLRYDARVFVRPARDRRR